MGTEDPLAPTTDFFDTHLSQCAYYASKLRLVPAAAALVAKFDESAALCQTAIANGRKSADMSATVATLPVILAKYEALSPAVKSALAAALAADVVPQHP